MCNIKQVKSKAMFPVIKEVLKNGNSVRITVTGTSMYPFLREGTDSVELSQGSFSKLCRGDIPLILRDSGEYILHRILWKKKDCFYIVGDAQQWIEGPLRPDQLVAVVTAVWRSNKRIECSSLLWILLSRLWLRLLPFRYFIIHTYLRKRKLLKKICKGEL